MNVLVTYYFKTGKTETIARHIFDTASAASAPFLIAYNSRFKFRARLALQLYDLIKKSKKKTNSDRARLATYIIDHPDSNSAANARKFAQSVIKYITD